ncbi:asparagine-linked glycosylation protein [Coemansia erecta]|nr:asparagine-linked glycosylation protein [Coemansia erecta]KAJ2889172.1 asparagine-linked glycosylation protein [Coemansia asiatica]
MPSLESFIYYSFAVGVVIMVFVAVLLGVQVLTLGTQKHQDENKERVKKATSPDTSTHEAYYMGFFHPFANAGGGGERVLWTMVKAIQDKYPFVVSVIYSGDNIQRSQLLQNAKAKFGLEINPQTIYVVELQRRWWVEHKFRRLTLLVQSLGSVWLAMEAINGFRPDVFVDTVGYAFTYPLVQMVSSRIPVVSYTHYPTISSDMRTLVASREAGVSNDQNVAGSAFLTVLKSAYYAGFARLYMFCGSFAATIMTNSSWTHGHIVRLFGKPTMTRVVYPPCDTKRLVEFPLEHRSPIVMSLAQFRPEKNHALQIEAFAQLLHDHSESAAPAGWKKPSLADILEGKRGAVEYPALVMLGGARNIEDEARAEELRQLAKRLDVERQVHVVVNAPWEQVLRWLRTSAVGVHTMRDEHFGINVVEMMAAGLLTIAHDSAGPKLDIVTPAIRCGSDGTPNVPADADIKKLVDDGGFPVGMVASTAGEFAQMMRLALQRDRTALHAAIRSAARQAAASRFSEEAFRQAFYRRFDPVIRWLDNQRSDSDDSFE